MFFTPKMTSLTLSDNAPAGRRRQTLIQRRGLASNEQATKDFKQSGRQST